MRAEAQVQNNNRGGDFIPSPLRKFSFFNKTEAPFFEFFHFFPPFSSSHHPLSYQLFDCRTAELISSLAREVSGDMKGTDSHV